MIEKAYKKLRLDALVIQQGRLTENNATKVSQSADRCCMAESVSNFCGEECH